MGSICVPTFVLIFIIERPDDISFHFAIYADDKYLLQFDKVELGADHKNAVTFIVDHLIK